MLKQALVITFGLVAFQLYGQYKIGYYYQNDGSKVSGWLEYNFGGMGMMRKSFGDSWLTYKEKIPGKKKILTTDDISSFVIEKDSFAILRNFKPDGETVYPKDFAKVLEVGKIVLYQYYTYGYRYTPVITISGTNSLLFIQKGGRVEGVSNKNFDEIVTAYLSDCPEIVKQISDGTLTNNDFRLIIQRYNQCASR